MQTKQMAGQIAALLFQYQAYVSWVCMLFISIKQARKARQSFNFAQNSLLLAGLAFSMCVYFIVAPQISARQNLKLWHSLGTALFAGQWICATVLLWRQNRV
jgi:hypothetical protein